MPENPETARSTPAFANALETTIRIGLVLLLLAWCFQIVRPFLTPIVWGFILAIAVAPAFRQLTAALGGRRRLAATMLVVLALVLFIVPAAMLSGTMVAGLRDLAAQIHSGELRVPPPPARIAEWPVVGKRLSDFWSLAASNLAAALERLSPEMKIVGGWLLGTAAGVGFAILEFVFSTIIAGIVLARGVESRAGLERLVTRLAGANGRHFVELAESTVRSVAVGIVGVAIIQSTLVGIGFALVGLSGAGLWAVVALFLCIIQLGPAILLLPAVVYVIATAAPLTAGLFLVWSIFVTLIDNFLKPLLLGRGVDAPVVVIFVGAIGGFLAMGIIGLFLGSVVLVLFHTLFTSWLDEDHLRNAETATSSPESCGGAGG